MAIPNSIILTFSILLSICQPIQAETTPAEVYIELEELSADIHSIRREMGIPEQKKPSIEVSGAQPREVYFQAQTVLEKVSRLHFDLLRDRPNQPDIKFDDAKPEDVLVLVRQASLLAQSIRKYLNIKPTVAIPAQGQDTSYNATDVYILMVDISRSLNEMIEDQFAPAETFQQLTYGVSIASTILLQQGSQKILGKRPEYESRKMPRDVYAKLIAANNQLHEVIKKYGGSCLTLGSQEAQRPHVSPADVYDLASLLVSELNYLRNLVDAPVKPHAPYYPGKKFPSHAYQRASQLHSQIEIMLEGSLR